MFSPLLKKAEEKACVKKDENTESPDSKDGGPSPPKKLCSVYAKQLARMPPGDQGLLKETSMGHMLVYNPKVKELDLSDWMDNGHLKLEINFMVWR